MTATAKDRGQLLAEISQTLSTAIAQMTDVDAVCHTLLHSPALLTLIPSQAAAICLWDADGKIPERVLHRLEAEESASGATALLAEGYAARAAAERQPLLLTDVAQYTEATPCPDDAPFPYKSYLAVPITLEDRLLGLAEFAATEADAFTEPHLTDMQVIASQLAVGIDHIRLHHESARSVSELSLLFEASRELSSTLAYDELLQSLTRHLIEKFSARDCAILHFDQVTCALKLLYQHRDGAEVLLPHLNKTDLWRTVQDKPTLHILRSHRVAAESAEAELLATLEAGTLLAVPLVSRETVTGMVLLLAESKTAFTAAEARLIQSLVNQANVAMENARLFSLTDQALQHRIEELSGLQRASSELNSTLDMDKIFSLVLGEAMRVTRADFGEVSLCDPHSGQLTATKRQKRSHSKKPPTQTPLTTVEVDKATTLQRQAVDSAKIVLLSDLAQQSEHKSLSKGMRSCVVVPIYYAQEPVGLINLESRQPNFFSEGQLRYLEALANHAAVAINNAREYQTQAQEREQANRRADQLSRLAQISNNFRTNRPLREILEDIAYAIADSVGYKVAIISVVRGDPPMIYHEVGAGVPLVHFGALQKAEPRPLANVEAIMLDEFRISQSYFIPVEHRGVWLQKLDFARIQQHFYADIAPKAGQDGLWQTGDLLLTPLMDAEDRLLGLLTVDLPDTGKRPTEHAVQILETFANHAATAIENAQLFASEQRRRHIADTLRGVAETISSQLDFNVLLDLVLRELKKVVNYETASLQRLERDQLVIIGGYGWEDNSKVVGLTFPMGGENPNRLVMEQQEPIIIDNVQRDYQHTFDDPPHDRIRGWLGVPLTYGTNILGLLALDSTQTGFFSQEDADVVLAFANQVAVAMVNANLYKEARQQVKQLSALTEVAQALNRALDLNEVLNLVLDAVSDLAEATQGSIWLIDKATNTVRIANTKNIPSFLVELFNEHKLSVISEPFASVIQSGEVSVGQGDDAPTSSIKQHGFPFSDEVIYVPLKTDDEVIGLLIIETTLQDKHMLEVVTILANLAAVAIESTRLLADTRQRANEMQHLYNLGVEINSLLEVRQVMRSVVSNAVSLTETHVGTILVRDESVGHYLLEGTAHTEATLAHFALDQIYAEGKQKRVTDLGLRAYGKDKLSMWYAFTKEIIDSKRPLILNFSGKGTPTPTAGAKHAYALGVQAVLGVPIVLQQEIIGAILIGSTTPRNFSRYDEQLLSFVANQATEAIHNAQLVQRLNLLTGRLEERVEQRTQELEDTLDELRRERDRVDTLYQIARELSASFDLDRVLSQALNLLSQAMRVEHGSILLLDRDTNKLIHRAALGRTKSIPRGGIETRYRLGYGLAGKAMKTRQPRVIPDLSVDPDWVINEKTPNHRSALVVPLISGEDVVGALMLFHQEVSYFTQNHLKLVTAAGSQVATAINNAELYRLITDQASRLGVMLRTQNTETAKNKAILAGITDGVLVLDANRDIVLLNPKAAEILEISDPQEIENQPLRQILGRSDSPRAIDMTQQIYDQIIAALEEMDAGAPAAEFRVAVEDKAVVVTLAPVALGAEEMPSIVSVLRDISREAEIERLRNEFISTVSHELRTPMTSIKGYADLLIAAHPMVGDLTEKQRSFVEVIQANANRLTELVNDILEISRIETGRIKLELKPLDLAAIVDEVVLSFKGQFTQKAMELTLDLAEHLPQVYADKARVIQILVNLIGNAWQYTPEGGEITVRAYVRDEQMVQVDVQDTGIGIVEKDLRYIFDRFFRSERTDVQIVDGTGLGLSITSSFVKMLDGEIWAESELDVGSTFSFTLPIVSEERVAATVLEVEASSE